MAVFAKPVKRLARAAGVFTVSRDRDHLRLVELDCVLCRAGLA
jgi:hypothetical protein